MHLLEVATIFLLSAVLLVPLFQRFKLGAVLGYLAAGMVLGPWGLGVVPDAENTLGFAEFGVALLLFLVGLELEPARLWSMRRLVFGLGGAQVALAERGQIGASHGRQAFAVLLFQDIVVIPLLALLPLLAYASVKEAANSWI